MNAQFWIVLTGAVVMVITLTMAGLVQGTMWRDASVPFIETVVRMRPYWAIRALSGVLLMIGFYLFAYILWQARKPANSAGAAEE